MATIHPTALVSPDATLHASVHVGAGAIIEGAAVLGANCRVLPYAQILGRTTIGDDCVIGRGAILGEDPQDLSFDPATDSGVVIGEKNTIRELVTIHRGSKPGALTRVGDRNFLMAGVHLAHDVRLGHDNILANNCLLAGHVDVGNRVFLGGGSVFHQFIRLGDYCLSQGNSAVSKDIPPFCVVSQLNGLCGLNIIGLRRAGFDSAERIAIKRAYDLVFRGKMPLSDALRSAETQEWPEAASIFFAFLRQKGKKGVCFPG